MIIKSMQRGGFRAMSNYFQSLGKNELRRTVEISDIAAAEKKDGYDWGNLDEAFQNMWAACAGRRIKKPLHHVAINPCKDEHLTDKQLFQAIAILEKKFGYAKDEHRRVVIEHTKPDGSHHFHVCWLRVNDKTGKAVRIGRDGIKSKMAGREIEKALGLKTVVSRRHTRANKAAHIMANKLLKRGGSNVGRRRKPLGRKQPEFARRFKNAASARTAAVKETKGQSKKVRPQQAGRAAVLSHMRSWADKGDCGREADPAMLLPSLLRRDIRQAWKPSDFDLLDASRQETTPANHGSVGRALSQFIRGEIGLSTLRDIVGDECAASASRVRAWASGIKSPYDL